MWLPQPSRASRLPSTNVSTSSGTSAGTALVWRLEIRSPTRVPSSAEVAAPHLAPLPAPSSTSTLEPICQPPPTHSLKLATSSGARLPRLPLSGLRNGPHSEGGRGTQMGESWLEAGLCGPRVAGSMTEKGTPGLSCPVIGTALSQVQELSISVTCLTYSPPSKQHRGQRAWDKVPRVSMKRHGGLLPNGVGEGSLGR